MEDFAMDISEISKNIIETSSYLYEKGLVPGKAGNISIRSRSEGLDIVAVTPSGLSLKSLDETDIVIVDMGGKLVSSSKHKPTSELLMHLNVYHERKDINAVVHTHSPITTGFAFAEEKIERLEGFGPIEEPYIPFVNYYPPGSVELADAVSEGLKNEDLVVLKSHGVVALGENLEDATILAEFVEASAKIQVVKKILMTNRF